MISALCPSWVSGEDWFYIAPWMSNRGLNFNRPCGKGLGKQPASPALILEIPEQRYLLASVTINAGTTIRSVDTKWLGINTSPWDSQLSTTQTSTMTTAMRGLTTPCVSAADRMSTTTGISSAQSPTAICQTIGQQAAFIAAHGNHRISRPVNYGTASPQEAAAELAYLNGATSDNTVIGLGEQWSTTSNSWVDVDWGKVSDWANLRAALPNINDGKNFLRINHPAPFGFHYWGIGNEIYGSTWETDEHGTGGDHLPMPAGTTSTAS